MKSIIKHEWRLLWRDRTAWMVALILVVALGYGIYNGRSWVTFQRQAIERELKNEKADFSEWREETRRIEVGQLPDSPFSARNAASIGTFYARTAALPPAEFAGASIGQSDIYPYFFKVKGERRDSFLDSQEMENPVNLLSGRFDVAFVIVYLLPLLILALSYNRLSGERENGALSLLLAQGVKLRTLIAGKIIARALLVTGTTIGLTLIGLIVTGLSLPGEALSWKFSFWSLAVILNSLFWFALAALVNSRGWNSTTNAVALSGLWLLVALLFPAFIHQAASWLHPMPPRMEMIEATRNIETSVRSQAPELLEQYYRRRPEFRPANYDPRKYDFPVWWTAIQGEIDRRMEPVLSRYEISFSRQQAFVNGLSWLSPALLTQEVANDLAGTGWARNRKFTEQVKQFHREHRAFFEPKAYGKIKLTSSDYDLMPRFAFLEESAGAVARRVAIGLIGLLAPALIIGWLALRALRRYPLVG